MKQIVVKDTVKFKRIVQNMIATPHQAQADMKTDAPKVGKIIPKSS